MQEQGCERDGRKGTEEGGRRTKWSDPCSCSDDMLF